MYFFKRLLDRKKSHAGIVAISFLPSGLAIAVASIQKTNQLKLIHSEFIPSLTLDDQRTQLLQLVTQYKLTEHSCYLVLASGDYRRINIEAPNVAANEMTSALRWKINDLIDFPVENAVIDYYAAPESFRAASPKMLEVIVSPEHIINPYINFCKEAGLKLKVIDIQETCLRNLAVLLSENQRGIAILHLLEFSGTLLIQKEGTIYLSRAFDIGYSMLDLDEHFELSPVAAKAQNNLISEIQRSLDYVESYYGMPPISTLAVVPLAVNTQYLLNVLNNNHGIIARMMDLSALIECDNILDDALQSLCTPAIGATLRHIIEPL